MAVSLAHELNLQKSALFSPNTKPTHVDQDRRRCFKLMASVDRIEPASKRFISMFQEKIDEAASNGGMSEGTYMELCKLTKDYNTHAKEEMVLAQMDTYAEMVSIIPVNAGLCCSREFTPFGPWDARAIRKVFEMSKDNKSDVFWSDLMEEYVELIFDKMMEYAPYDKRALVMHCVVESADTKTQRILAKVFEDKRQCFLCTFVDEMDEVELESYGGDQIGNAPRLITSLKKCGCSKEITTSTWNKLKSNAREYAKDAHWQDKEFVRVVGPKVQKRLRSNTS